jgi:hypothetical protein
MAEIKKYQSQTNRQLPQGGPLNLQAPDQGIVGRAVSQLGEVVGDIGAERAKITAAARATAAHSTYRKELLNVERTARRLDPGDAEEYYKQHSKKAYDKGNNGLSSSYARSLYSRTAGETEYRSRAKFYVEHDKRLVSTAIATGDVNAVAQADIASDPAAKFVDRWKSMTKGLDVFRDLYKGGFIDTEDAVKRQRAWAGTTLERTLRAYMLGHKGEKGGAVGIISRFKNGKLGDKIVDQLVAAADPDEVIKIKARMELAAHRIETHKRQRSDRSEKLAKRAIDIETGKFYSVEKTAAGLNDARSHYDSLLRQGGFSSKSERESAQLWLGSLGDSEFADKAETVAFRTSKEGSSPSSVGKLHGYDRDNNLTPERVEHEKSGLTESAYKFWMGQVKVERKEGHEAMIKIMDAKFKYTRYQNKGDMFEKEQTLSAYSRATGEMHSWMLTPEGKKANHSQIVTKGNDLIDEEIKSLQKQLTQEFLSKVMLNRVWKKVLAPIPVGEQVKGTNPNDAMVRAMYYLAKSTKSEEQLSKGHAMTVLRKLAYYRDFGISTTPPAYPVD